MTKIILIISLLNATLIYCLNKWGWFDWYETRKPKWLLWCKPCFFCFGFRLAMVEVFLLVLYLQFYTWQWFYVPFCCASLTFLVVKKIIIEG